MGQAEIIFRVSFTKLGRRDDSENIEMYSDISELAELCSLVGPYGIKAINREILREIYKTVDQMRVRFSSFFSPNLSEKKKEGYFHPTNS
jgi:hypothetical protein